EKSAATGGHQRGPDRSGPPGASERRVPGAASAAGGRTGLAAPSPSPELRPCPPATTRSPLHRPPCSPPPLGSAMLHLASQDSPGCDRPTGAGASAGRNRSGGSLELV